MARPSKRNLKKKAFAVIQKADFIFCKNLSKISSSVPIEYLALNAWMLSSAQSFFTRDVAMTYPFLIESPFNWYVLVVLVFLLGMRFKFFSWFQYFLTKINRIDEWSWKLLLLKVAKIAKFLNSTAGSTKHIQT